MTGITQTKKIFKNPEFLDYREKKPYMYFSSDSKEYNPGDIIVDQYNNMGYVKYVSEKKGPYVQFVDDLEGYPSELELNISKLKTANINQFTQNRQLFGELTKVSRILVSAIEKILPYVYSFNDGNTISIRASTNKTITRQYTKIQLATSHTFFSCQLIPKWDVIFDNFFVKYSDRGSRFSYMFLKQIFLDLDKNLKNKSRFKWRVEISHDDTYNKFVWKAIEREFKKYQIKDKSH